MPHLFDSMSERRVMISKRGSYILRLQQFEFKVGGCGTVLTVGQADAKALKQYSLGFPKGLSTLSTCYIACLTVMKPTLLLSSCRSLLAFLNTSRCTQTFNLFFRQLPCKRKLCQHLQ